MKRNNRAFTLLEIMIMIGILALLATLMINKTGGVFDSSKKAVAKIFVNDTLKISLARYQMHMGSFPTTAEGLAALVTAPGNASANWEGPYTEKIPPDPYGEPYQYRSPGTHNKTSYDLFSKGFDRQEGTEDDIGNW